MSDRLDPADVLTLEELAARLKVKPRWIRYKAAGHDHGAKPFPVIHCGRHLRFIWPDVVEWLRSNNS